MDTANFPVETVCSYEAIVFCNKLSVIYGLSPAYILNGSTDPETWGDVPAMWNDYRWNGLQIVAGSTGYRLPTSAQWEYACRAGTTTAYNTGEDVITNDTCWYTGNSKQRPHPVGEKLANAWGLYDMHGSIGEWCWDWYNRESYTSDPQTDPTGPADRDSNGYRVLRGGSWRGSAANVRSASRGANFANVKSNESGFRIIRP
jgi:formylglycine-generating enzyme required for sulfatase activity